ncbi:hypothetical protein ABW21_db0200839 [Orbilia brochopaga]|nr:hypothetical protein ABW21_db0200839 [Drechslerella brochopaga]
MDTAKNNIAVDSLHIVESVDGADFRTYFAQVKIGAVETHSQVPAQVPANEAASMPANAFENAAIRPTLTNENSESRIQTGSQGENSVFENSEKRTNTLDLEDIVEPNEAKEEEVDQSDVGFVKYLSDKASYEIQQDNIDATKPYIKRLKEIKGTRKVIAELRHQIYSRLVAQQIERIQQGDVESASKALQETFAPVSTVLAPYKLQLENAITDYYIQRAEENLSKCQYKEAVRDVVNINMRIPSDNPPEQYVTALADFVPRFGKQMASDAVSRVQGRQFVDALHLFYNIYKTPWLFRFITDVGVAFAVEYLKIAVEYVDADRLDEAWNVLKGAHLVLWLLEPTSPSRRQFSTSHEFINFFSVTPGHRFEFIERTYTAGDGIPSEVLDIRFAQLDQFIKILEKKVMDDLRDENWEAAFEKLLSLRPLQKAPPRIYSNTGKRVLARWSVIELFVNTRIRNWGFIMGKNSADDTPASPDGTQNSPGNASRSSGKPKRSGPPDKGKESLFNAALNQVEHLTPEYLYLYHLACAEIAYFHLRDMDMALMNCQRATRFNSVPPFLKDGSDALYLQARVFTRKGLPLDADYCYSLLSGKPYNQWAIYGTPGAVLRKSGLDMARGTFVGLDRAKLLEIMKELSTSVHSVNGPGDGAREDDPRHIAKSKYYSRNPWDVKMVNALFADDIDWVANFNDLPIEAVPFTKIKLSFRATFLHYATLTSFTKWLRICLQNPWISVDERDVQGRTSLHLAAKNFEPKKIELLLNRGADHTAVDMRGYSILHSALEMTIGEPLEGVPIQETLRMILDLKINDANGQQQSILTARNAIRQTPLHVLQYIVKTEIGKLIPTDNEQLYLGRFRDAYLAIIKHPAYSPTDADAVDDNNTLAIEDDIYLNLFELLNDYAPKYDTKAPTPYPIVYNSGLPKPPPQPSEYSASRHLVEEAKKPSQDTSSAPKKKTKKKARLSSLLGLRG